MGRADLMAEPADIALFACVLNGDETGLAALLNRHWQSLVRYAYSILGDWDAAEDVAEEVFVRLWERRETWGLEGSVLGLLFRIARNLSLDERRQEDARRRASKNSLKQGVAQTPAEYFDDLETRSALAAAVAGLSQRRREVFLLVREHGLSYRETSEALGLVPQTVANHFSMALEDLRKALGPFLTTAWQPSCEPVSLTEEAVGQ